YPEVRVQLHVSNRRVDVINEGIDVALRVRTKLDDDGSLVMRSFGQIQELLVASPDYLRKMGRPTAPQELSEHVTLSMSEDDPRQRWELHGPDGDVQRVEIKPRVMGFDLPMLMSLAIQGVGITLLPESVCADAVRRGELQVVLPAWRLPQGIFHAVFASRRGMLPAVRVFIDFLAETVPVMVADARLGCGDINGKPCSESELKAFRRWRFGAARATMRASMARAGLASLQGQRMLAHSVSFRKSGRAVEGTGLENRRRVKPSVGSNPTSSANSSFRRYSRLRPRVASPPGGLHGK